MHWVDLKFNGQRDRKVRRRHKYTDGRWIERIPENNRNLLLHPQKKREKQNKKHCDNTCDNN